MKIANADDLRLYRHRDEGYHVEVLMKLQFFFRDNHPHSWQSQEEDAFIHAWQLTIKETWGNRALGEHNNGE